MTRAATSAPSYAMPAPADILALLKPITWFPPMWAFLCGVVSAGAPLVERWPFLIGGIALAGPLVCGTSQAVNDWYDRHVDAINEPGRPIPSGRIPGRWGLAIAIAGTLLSLLVALAVGPWIFAATCLGLLFAWVYSAPPLRLKTSGWIGPGVVALSYEGLTWFTGAAVMAGGLPGAPVLVVLLLYSLGAHGIMTLNDFKAVEGDRRTGVKSLPVRLGVRRAALVACAAMSVPQAVVALLLWHWSLPLSALAVAGSLVVQLALMVRLLGDPAARAPWYNATGTTLYVLGMMAAAIGLGTLP
ncbi:MAG: chlorophyll synthase ChlG [Sphingomonadaceae bacterium]